MAKGVHESTATLRRLAVDASIIDFCSEVRMRHEYYNNEEEPIEAVFSFPLSSTAAITGLVVTNGGHRLVGEVQKNRDATKAYNDAVNSGKTGVLVKEVTEDMFQCQVGNIAPASAVIVELTYVEELGTEESALRFKVPLTVVPRYIGAGGTPSVDTAESELKLEFSASFNMSMPVRELTSPTHSVVSSFEDGRMQGTVELAEAGTIDGDLDILFTLEDSGDEARKTPLVVVEKHPKHDTKAVLITLFPEIKATSSKSEVILMIDRSGSMRGTRIETAKEALQIFLRSLPTGCHFNIVSFGTSFEQLFKKSELYSEASLATATQHVDSMTANLGGTEVLTPLRAIVNSKKNANIEHRSVILLTDGAVSNTKAVTRLVAGQRDTRVFTLGIGSGCSTALVDGLAKNSGGVSEYVVEGEAPSTKVVRQLKRAMEYGLTDIKVDWNGAPLVTANAPTAIYRGDRLLLYGLQADMVGKPGSLRDTVVTISAKDEDGKTVQLKASVYGNEQAMLPGDLIHRMATQALVKENVNKQPLCEYLSLTYGVASKYCSFVVVDQSSGGEVRSVVKAVPAIQPASRAKAGSKMMFKGKKMKKSASSSRPTRDCAIGAPYNLQQAQLHVSFNADTFMLSGPPPPAPSCSTAACGPPPPSSGYRGGGGAPPAPRGVARGASRGASRSSRGKAQQSRQEAALLQRRSCIDECLDEMDDDWDSEAFESVAAPVASATLDDIIRKQSFNGSWSLVTAASVTGKSVGAIRAAILKAALDQSIKSNDDLVGTALVIAHILAKFRARAGDWELVVAKAEKWAATAAGANAGPIRSLVRKIAAAA